MRAEYQKAIERAGTDAGAAALAHSHFGFWLCRQAEWRAAASEYEQAAQLAVNAEQTTLAAQFRYAAALALQKAPRSKGRARKALSQAGSELLAAGEMVRYAQVQRHRAAMATRQGQPQKALNLIRRALQRCEAEPRAEANLALDEGVYAFQLGMRQEAAAALSRCQSLAAAHEWPLLAEQAETLYALLLGAPDQSAALSGPLALALRQHDDQNQLLTQALLAYKAGRLAKALQLAQRARDEALAAADWERYLRYASSTIMIALIQERRGQDSAALAVLLSCKKTLERHLGPEIGRFINTALDGLCLSWGQDRTEAALQQYRQTVKQQLQLGL